jgi:hypothetical protein
LVQENGTTLAIATRTSKEAVIIGLTQVVSAESINTSRGLGGMLAATITVALAGAPLASALSVHAARIEPAWTCVATRAAVAHILLKVVSALSVADHRVAAEAATLTGNAIAHALPLFTAPVAERAYAAAFPAVLRIELHVHALVVAAGPPGLAADTGTARLTLGATVAPAAGLVARATGELTALFIG